MTAEQFEEELKTYFTSARAKNPNFSARALAIQLGARPSMIQKVMRGDRRLGIRLARELALKMNAEIIEDDSRRSSTKRPRSWKLKLNGESRAEVSWLNLAILEMIKLSDFEPNENWISTRLGLPVAIVAGALSEMENQRMLARPPGKPWVDLIEDAASGSTDWRTTDVIRKMQKEILHLSIEQLETVSFEDREHGFSIMPVAKTKLPQLKKKIRQFQWQLSEFAQSSRTAKDSVYAFHVGLIGLTKKDHA